MMHSKLKKMIFALMETKIHVILTLHAHGANLLLLKAHVNQLKTQKHFQPAFSHVIKLNKKLKLKKLAHMVIKIHVMVILYAHGVNLLLLKAHAKQLTTQKHFQLVFLLVISLKKKLKLKKLAHMVIKIHVMALMNAHGVNLLQLKVHAKQF